MRNRYPLPDLFFRVSVETLVTIMLLRGYDVLLRLNLIYIALLEPNYSYALMIAFLYLRPIRKI